MAHTAIELELTWYTIWGHVIEVQKGYLTHDYSFTNLEDHAHTGDVVDSSGLADMLVEDYDSKLEGKYFEVVAVAKKGDKVLGKANYTRG